MTGPLIAAAARAAAPALFPTQPPPAPTPPAPPAWDPWQAAVGVLGGGAAEVVKAAVVVLLEGVWQSGLSMLRGAFGLADSLTEFDIVAQFAARQGGGGLHDVTAGVLWLAILVAIGLFFTQLLLVAVRGGRGMWRAVTGPFQFGLALAVVWATIGTALAAAGGLTDGLLTLGFGDGAFARIVDPPPADPALRDPSGGVRAILVEQPDLGPGLDDLTRALIMAVIGAVGWVCALGFAVEMVIRQAIILVVVAVSPIAAAGLLSEATSSWWWRTTRWLIAALLLEPALALVLAAGVGLLSSATGIAALLSAAAVLLSALFCPWAVYKLLAFVDPATGSGTQLRALAATYRPVAGGPGPGAGSRAAVEAAHTARFDRHTRTTSGSTSGSTSGAGSGGSRSGRIAAAAATAGRATYRAAARAGDTAAAAITTQGAQTGVGHGGPLPAGTRVPRPGGGPAATPPAPPATSSQKGTTAPKKTAPGKTAPGKTAPEKTAPEKTAVKAPAPPVAAAESERTPPAASPRTSSPPKPPKPRSGDQ